jgi:predicted peroxiredoxin
MAKILITGTHGAEDPTRASFPLHIARGAKESGYDVEIALAGDGPLVLKDAVRDSLLGVGMPPLKEHFKRTTCASMSEGAAPRPVGS